MVEQLGPLNAVSLVSAAVQIVQTFAACTALFSAARLTAASENLAWVNRRVSGLISARNFCAGLKSSLSNLPHKGPVRIRAASARRQWASPDPFVVLVLQLRTSLIITNL